MSTPTQKRSPRKPSQTARILETVELLLALQEEQGDPSVNQASADHIADRLDSIEEALSRWAGNSDNENLGSSDIQPALEDLSHSIQEQVRQATESLEAKLASATPSTVDSTELIEKLESIEQAFTKLNDLAPRLEQLEKSVSAVQSHLTRLETEKVFGQNESEDRTADAFAEQWDQQAERLKQDFKQQLDDHAEQLIARLASATPQPAEDHLHPEIAPTEDEDTASHWEKQKRAMLQKYGIDPEHRPLEEDKAKAKASAAAVKPTPKKPDARDSAADKLEELHKSINNISQEDSDAIEKLKKELNSKLRDAEVELSINRAKLSQEKAELEQKRTELEQRMVDLEAKLKERAAGDDKKSGSGLMSRFTRHLGK